jgi:flagellar hook assembly protein FlgD
MNKAPSTSLGLASPEMNLSTYPNPGTNNNTIRYSVSVPSQVKIAVYDMQGKLVKVLADKNQEAGVYNVQWDMSKLSSGTYLVTAVKDGNVKQTIKVVKN